MTVGAEAWSSIACSPDQACTNADESYILVWNGKSPALTHMLPSGSYSLIEKFPKSSYQTCSKPCISHMLMGAAAGLA